MSLIGTFYQYPRMHLTLVSECNLILLYFIFDPSILYFSIDHSHLNNHKPIIPWPSLGKLQRLSIN